jgi:hypothetical protein
MITEVTLEGKSPNKFDRRNTIEYLSKDEQVTIKQITEEI